MRSIALTLTLVRLAALWLLNVVGVKGEDEEHPINEFKYPTKWLAFNYMDTVEVTYTSNIGEPLLYTWCKDAAGEIKEQRLDHPPGMNSSALILLDFTLDIVATECWFNLQFDVRDTPIGANSESFQFNSTEGERKTFSLNSGSSPASSSSASSSSSIPTSSSPPVSSPTSSVTTSTDDAQTTVLGVNTKSPAAVDGASTSSPSPSSSAAASSNPGLSTGAQAGIGAGVGIIGILIGGALVALFFRRRKNRGGDMSGQDSIAEMSSSSYYPPTSGTRELGNYSFHERAAFSRTNSSLQHSSIQQSPVAFDGTNSPLQEQGMGYYYRQVAQAQAQAQAQASMAHVPVAQNDPFADSNPNAAPFVTYAISVGREEQKFRGIPPSAMRRHEMEAPNVILEMQ